MFSTYFDATDWTYAIDPQLSQAAWQHSRRQVTTWAQWNAYLNQLCLSTFLPQVQERTRAQAMDPAWADRTWAVANGSVITVNGVRLVLIPSEALDQSELEVPQEWIDIPSWAGDYYLAVYLTADLQTLHIAGYATHQQIKQQGCLDLNQRTYHLDLEALTPDLSLLWLTHTRYGQDQTRAPIAPPAQLLPPQVQALTQRLGDPSELLPRLEVPFASWAALLDNPTWHEQLYQQRQGQQQSAATQLVNRLSRWMQGQFDQAWQPLDAVLQPQQLAISTRSGLDPVSLAASIQRAKVIDLGQGQVALVVNLTPMSAQEVGSEQGVGSGQGVGSEQEVRIELQVHPTGSAIHLPGETGLRLLSLAGVELAQAQAQVTETIRLQFRAQYGEAFQLEISCNDQVVLEAFEV